MVSLWNRIGLRLCLVATIATLTRTTTTNTRQQQQQQQPQWMVDAAFCGRTHNLASTTTIGGGYHRQTHLTNSQRSSRFLGQGMRLVVNNNRNRKQTQRQTTKSQLNMFMGSDGGILGVGTPEVVSVLLTQRSEQIVFSSN